MNRAVLRFPKRGLDHRGLEEAEEGRIDFGSSVPGLAVVGRYVNEASVFAAELGRAGSEYSAVLESDGLVLDGTSAAAVVAGDKLSGSCPVLAVGRDGIVGLPIFGVLADLEIEGYRAVVVLEENGVPVGDIRIGGNSDGLAPFSVRAAHACEYLDIVVALGRACEPCRNNCTVVKRQNGRSVAGVGGLFGEYPFFFSRDDYLFGVRFNR